MPASIVQTYRAFAYNNAWANYRLLTACASLTHKENGPPNASSPSRFRKVPVISRRGLRKAPFLSSTCNHQS
jgi:hypothetical protein